MLRALSADRALHLRRQRHDRIANRSRRRHHVRRRRGAAHLSASGRCRRRASWDDPGSFAAGEPVAEYSIRLLDTLQRQAPGVGVLVGDGQLTQETAAEFSLDGERYRFGVVGIAQRLRYVGSPLDSNLRRACSPSASPDQPACSRAR